MISSLRVDNDSYRLCYLGPHEEPFTKEMNYSNFVFADLAHRRHVGGKGAYFEDVK
jgi:hypothetical protein